MPAVAQLQVADLVALPSVALLLVPRCWPWPVVALLHLVELVAGGGAAARCRAGGLACRRTAAPGEDLRSALIELQHQAALLAWPAVAPRYVVELAA